MAIKLQSRERIIRPAVVERSNLTRLAHGASVLLFGKMTGRVLAMVGQIVLARLLGPEVFGLYIIGFTMVRVLGVLAPLGLDNGAIHFGSQHYRGDPAGLRAVLRQSLLLAVLSGLALGGVLYLCAPWISTTVFQKPELSWVLRSFAPALALMSALKVAAAATRISQRMRYSTQAEDVSQPAANLLLVVVFHVLGWQLGGAIVATVWSFGLGMLLALIYTRQLFPEARDAGLPSPPLHRELLRFSVPTALAGMFSFLMVWLDRLLIGYFRPAAEVGIYQAVSQSSLLFVIICQGLASMIAPMIADLHHRKEHGELEELVRVSTKWGLYLSIPLFLLICAMPERATVAVFGESYAAGAIPLLILCMAQFVNVATGPIGSLMVMTGKQRLWFLNTASMLGLNIALNWLLIPRYGLTGSAIGTGLSIVGLFAIGLVQVRRTLGIWPYDRRYLKLLVASAAGILPLLVFQRVDILPPLLHVALAGLSCSAFFGGALLALGLDPEDRNCVQLLRRRKAMIQASATVKTAAEA